MCHPKPRIEDIPDGKTRENHKTCLEIFMIILFLFFSFVLLYLENVGVQNKPKSNLSGMC